MSKWIFALIQFFPLSAFATYAFLYGAPSNDRWIAAFELGALLAGLQLLVLVPQKTPLNRLVLAGNLYLILGGLAAFLNQWWYLELYNYLRESAILMLMALVGLLSTFLSPSGFIGVIGSERKFSMYLLIASIAMIPIAILFEGDRTYAAVLPIIFLAVLQRWLAHTSNRSIRARGQSC